MLSLENIYTLYFQLYFRLGICLNKLSINQRIIIINNKFKNTIYFLQKNTYIYIYIYILLIIVIC